MTGDMVNAKDNDFEVFINLAEQISKALMYIILSAIMNKI